MIIKKKYTVIKKTIEETPVLQKTPPVKSESDIEKKIEDSDKNIKEEKDERKTKKNIDDLDLAIENIKFEQREERREGSRRRGYRRTQDRNLLSRAQKDAESIKEAAKQEGYKAGIDSAQQDLQNLKANLSEFFNYKEEVFQKVSECIMEVSVEIARKIINKETETNREYIIPIIKGVVEEINKTENKITLKVMPKDVEIVRDKIEEVFSGDFFEAKISVIPNNEIKEGGVIVETSNGIIDATIETQLDIIEKALKRQEES